MSSLLNSENFEMIHRVLFELWRFKDIDNFRPIFIIIFAFCTFFSYFIYFNFMINGLFYLKLIEIIIKETEKTVLKFKARL